MSYLDKDWGWVEWITPEVTTYEKKYGDYAQ